MFAERQRNCKRSDTPENNKSLCVNVLTRNNFRNIKKYTWFAFSTSQGGSAKTLEINPFAMSWRSKNSQMRNVSVRKETSSSVPGSACQNTQLWISDVIKGTRHVMMILPLELLRAPLAWVWLHPLTRSQSEKSLVELFIWYEYFTTIDHIWLLRWSPRWRIRSQRAINVRPLKPFPLF